MQVHMVQGVCGCVGGCMCVLTCVRAGVVLCVYVNVSVNVSVYVMVQNSPKLGCGRTCPTSWLPGCSTTGIDGSTSINASLIDATCRAATCGGQRPVSQSTTWAVPSLRM